MSKQEYTEQDEGIEGDVTSWQDEFNLRDNLLQRDIYPFEALAGELGGLDADGFSMRAEHALKAAIAAGWLEAPTAEVLKDSRGRSRYMLDGVDVDELHPGKVLWYGSRVVVHYQSAITVPKN